ncbi:uncharacterized protein LOC101854399 [Aplysia californica]|uniref:Uncharacterized protein LOC101854399 n=1 Tax=Aplysia californica TaxID=6500 RepID=A0ABM0JIP4_APLCA|nr:uncharacterized protein LOC101854399 [Aplysia californica]
MADVTRLTMMMLASCLGILCGLGIDASLQSQGETIDLLATLLRRSEAVRSPVTLLFAKREVGSSRTTFVVRYKLSTTATPVVSCFDDEVYEPLTDTTQQVPGTEAEEGTVWETAVTTEASYRAVVLTLFNPDSGSLFLILKNDVYSNVTQRDIFVPSVSMEPAHEVVYEPGNNARFKVIAQKAARNQRPLRSMLDRIHLDLYDPNTRSLKMQLLYHSDFAKIRRTEESADDTESVIDISTSHQTWSGLILMNGFPFVDAHALVKEAQESRWAVLRPSTQELAFPHGFIGFMQLPNFHDADPSFENITCNYADDKAKCHIRCTVYGNNLTGFPVFKVEPNGSRTQISSELRRYYGNYAMESRAVVHPSARESSTDEYVCVGRTADGQTAVHTTFVRFIRPVEFDRTESSVVLVNDTTALATCVALGDPLPDNITFTLNYKKAWQNRRQASSVHRTPDRLIASKIVPISPDTGALRTVVCVSETQTASAPSYTMDVQRY